MRSTTPRSGRKQVFDKQLETHALVINGMGVKENVNEILKGNGSSYRLYRVLSYLSPVPTVPFHSKF